MEKNKRYQFLRNKYPTFEYTSFDIKEHELELEIVYNFKISGLVEFHPKWILKKPPGFQINIENKEQIENLVFNLGMVEAISYFKCVCPKMIIIKAGFLDSFQIAWYKKLFINGLGEFSYINNIVKEMDEKTFLEIRVDAPKKNTSIRKIDGLKGNLIAVGGGKDSIVTLDVLKDEIETNHCYVVNMRKATRDTIKKAGYDNEKSYEALRVIDKKIIELNKEDFLNGHTPFSAILAFSSYLVAVMLKKKYIVLSNEASANESNIKGTKINHQYSKSIEFEKDFRIYANNYLSKDGPEYFSLLRPLTEWQIVKCFSNLKEYFSIFQSCNVGSKKDVWCESCPKCMYVYIMLKAFLPEEELKVIFSKNMLEDKAYEALLMGLTHQDYNKPFECVGTKEEISLAIDRIIKKNVDSGEKLSPLLREYKDSREDVEDRMKNMEERWDKENFLPEVFELRLKKYIWGK